MPYTLAHPAAVLLFWRSLRRFRMLTATLMGSMAPDFGYFMPLRPVRTETHSAMSLVTFSLPAGLLAYWLFQRVIKPPLVNLLPDQAYMRWRPFGASAELGSLTQWIQAVCGVLLGATTHLLWDSFTHDDSPVMSLMPGFAARMFGPSGNYWTGPQLLENASSLLGLTIVLIVTACALRTGRRQPVAPRSLNAAARRGWVLLYAITAAVFTVGLDFMDHAADPYRHLPGGQTGAAAVAFLRALTVATVGVSIMVNLHLRLKRCPPAV